MPRLLVDAFGTIVRVDCTDAAAPRLRAQWARCLVEPGTGEHAPDSPLITHRGSELADTDDYSLASALTSAAISAQAGERLMFHACGLADPDSGRVAVLVAASGTGKTTAAVTLSQAGLGYVSDETIAIDDDGCLRRYPKPVSVVIDPAVPYGKSQHGPDELGMLTAPDGELRAAAVVLLRRDREAHRTPELTRVPLIDGLVELIPQTSALPRMTRPLARLASVVAGLGGPWRLDYSEIGEAVDLVRAALAGHDQPVDFLHHPPAPATDEKDCAAGVLRRGDYLDAIEHDGRVLLMRDSQPVVLDGLGALAWLHADGGLAEAEVLEVARQEFGDHPQAPGLVTAAVRELIAHGVLR